MKDALVIGGGLVGGLIALELARVGIKVTVLDRSAPGREASRVAAGILAPTERAPNPVLLAYAQQSAAMHEALAEELAERVSADVGYRKTGTLHVAETQGELDGLEAWLPALRAGGVEARILDGDAARALEPALSSSVLGALELAQQAQVDPPSLFAAVRVLAEKHGVVFEPRVEVERLVVEDTADGRRATGVRTRSGTRSAQIVVACAGAWTAELVGLGVESGIEPVRGQILTTDLAPSPVKRMIIGGRGYVIPKHDGRLLCGSTLERVGFSRETTFGGLASITSAVVALIPALASAPLRDHAVGFRPGSPNGLPLVGRAGAENLFVAAGHFRNGILLGPLTAKIICDLVQGRVPDVDISPLDPHRFKAAATSPS